MSSLENKEMQIISNVMAQLKKTNTDTSNLHSTMPLSSSQNLMPSSSPTSIDPAFSATPSASKESSDTLTTMQQQEEGDDKMTTTAINPGGLLHTVWNDNTPGNNDIFYKRDGADYDPTTEDLTNDAGTSVLAAIAVSGNNVHVVWQETSTGEILYKRSINSGATFGPIINLSNNAGFSELPAIAVSGNNVHVVWDDNTPGNFDIFYKRSTDKGASFTEPTKNLSGNAGISTSPSMAVSGNNVHVVWNDDTLGNGEIFYRRSLDGGTTFPNIIKNLSGNAGFSFEPAIAVSGNNVHVVWTDDIPGNFDILYRRSLDSGSTFPNIIKNLSGNIGTSARSAIAVSGSNVHVVWDDGTLGSVDILYRRSLDNGGTFPDTIKNLSGSAFGAISPNIAVSGNNVYVVWEQEVDILYRTSPDNGATFPNIMTDLSANTGSSQNAAVAAS